MILTALASCYNSCCDVMVYTTSDNSTSLVALHVPVQRPVSHTGPLHFTKVDMYSACATQVDQVTERNAPTEIEHRQNMGQCSFLHQSI